MAVAGSAVGLGNFLRFPGLAAQYGGGAFMLAYAVSFLIIGLPIGWAEWTLGRHAGTRGYHSAPGAFAVILNKPWAKYAGITGVIVPVVIYMYYVFIESWCLGYAVKFWTGGVRLTTPEQTRAMFEVMSGQAGDGAALAMSWDAALPWLVIVFVFNFYLIHRGLSGGIEKMCNFGMPLLMVLALVVLVRVLTLGAPDPARPHDNVLNGLGYMWNPDKVQVVSERQLLAPETTPPKPIDMVGDEAIAEAERMVVASNGALKLQTVSPWGQLLNPGLWLAAAGQICFSLAVGFGIIIVYSSYLGREDDVVLSGLTAAARTSFARWRSAGSSPCRRRWRFSASPRWRGRGRSAWGSLCCLWCSRRCPSARFSAARSFSCCFSRPSPAPSRCCSRASHSWRRRWMWDGVSPWRCWGC